MQDVTPVKGRLGALLLSVVCALTGLTSIAESPASAEQYPNAPVGALDSATVRFGNPSASVDTPFVLKVSGWAADRDFPNSKPRVDLWVDGQSWMPIDTGVPRPDVKQALPWARPDSGWSMTIDLATVPGTTLCFYIADLPIGAAHPTALGCRELFKPGPKDPVGSLDGAYSSPGQLQLSGWAGDPDGTATTRLRIYYDDELEPQLEPRTSQARPDVQRAFPRLSATTGFSVTLPITPGVHTICIVGENTGPAGLSFADLGCVHGTVPSSRAPAAHDPRGGGLDSMTRHAANVTNAVGWAYDPDTGSPVTVKVRILAMKAFSGNVYPDRYLTLTSRATTGVARPDVQAVYPAAGASSGFDSAMVTSGGPVRVACAYALNVGPGVNRLLGCLFAPAP